MQPVPDTGRRLALLVATSVYSDPDLRELRAPGRDAAELSEVLRDRRIGGFEVQMLVNAASGEAQEGIEDFCADKHPGDQLLIYLSCHGVLDSNGRLYYAAANTRRQRLAATAIASAWLIERLDDSRAHRQIVVLDCCHSGAFARGAKGDQELALQQRFEPHGRGRVVLTASRSTEYSFEGGQASGEGVPSVFTHAIINGLRTGDADLDKDGLITVNDLSQYVYDIVRTVEPRQTPQLWTYGAEGSLLVAHSVRGAVIEPEPLPEDLRITLESPRRRIRETGVSELAELLEAARPGLALTARQTLERIAGEDHPQVAALARIALGSPGGAAAQQVRRELADRALQEEQAHRSAQEQASREAEALAARNAETSAAEGRPAGLRSRTDRRHEPTVGSKESPSSAGTSARPADRVARQASESDSAVSEARPPPHVLPARDDRATRRIRRNWYFWIGGVFLAVMIAGIIGLNTAPANSTLSLLMGGVTGVGIAGAVVSLGLGVWWDRTSHSINELLYRRERYFWISGAFVLVMIIAIVGFNLGHPHSGQRNLMGTIIAISSVGAFIMFGLGVWLGHARRLFLNSFMSAHSLGRRRLLHEAYARTATVQVDVSSPSDVTCRSVLAPGHPSDRRPPQPG
jgi:Caspase domain